MDFHIEAQYRPVAKDFLCSVEAAETFDVAGTKQVISVLRQGYCKTGHDLEKLRSKAGRAVEEELRGLVEVRDLIMEWGGKIEISE